MVNSEFMGFLSFGGSPEMDGLVHGKSYTKIDSEWGIGL